MPAAPHPGPGSQGSGGWATRLALGCVGGLLYAASIPKAEVTWLAWICLTPPLTYLLLQSLRSRAPLLGQGFAMGLAFGLVAGLGRLYWIAETLANYGGLGSAMALVTNGLLILYLSLYPACFFAFAARLARSSSAATWPLPWLLASAWVGLEWAQEWLFTGFPWQLLGYSQYRDLALIQVASVAGVYGVSFALAAVGAALAQLVASRLARRTCRGPGWSLGAVAIAVAALYAGGRARLDSLAAEWGEPVRCGIVQGNIPQDRKWKAGHKTAATTELYAGLTRQLAQDHPDLDVILFPETALPYYFGDPAFARYADQIRALAQTVDTPLLVGSLDGSTREWPGTIYNRAYMLDTGGEVVGHADKVHLVPFGEYLPLEWLFQYLEGLTAESGRFTAGQGHRTVPLPGRHVPLGVFICYESIFPEIPRALTRLGAQILVNTTNDAWFGTTAAPAQHFSMAVLRAVETGRAVVRAANTGISGAIAPNGAILEATPLFVTTAVVVEVPARVEITPYVQYGDLFVGACLLTLGLWWGLQVCSRTRRVAREVARAEAELAAWAQAPKPLARALVLLHGYASGPGSWQGLYQRLKACAPNAAPCLHMPQLDASNPIPELAAALCAQLPSGEPVDLVGHSMGGLVACEVARLRACGDRVFALASPFGGSRLVEWVVRLRLARSAQLADMVPGSTFLERLNRSRPPLAARIYTWRVRGDVAVPARSAEAGGTHCEYSAAPWATPLTRHRLAHTDARVHRDLIHYLRT